MALESPGNIRNQLGRSLNMIRLNVEQEDIEGLANHVRYAVTICSPYIDEDNMGNYRFPKSLERPEDVFDEAMGILERLLRQMAKKGLYAFMEEEAADASSIALE